MRIGLLVRPLVLVVLLAAACSPAPTPGPPAATPSPDVADLDGLDFDVFVDRSFERLLVRDPELVTALGLGDVLGVGDDRLTDISDAYVRETQALETAILGLLEDHDRSALTGERRTTYDVYRWWLTDRVAEHAFADSDYPLDPTVFSVDRSLVALFTDLQPLDDVDDARDYLARLAEVHEKLDQLADGLERRADRGVILPGFLLAGIVADLTAMAESTPTDTPFHRALRTRLGDAGGVDAATRAALLAEAEIADTVLPAYRDLVDRLEPILRRAPDEPGVGRLPDGRAYYAHLLRHFTSTDLTVEEVQAIGHRELDRIDAEMRQRFGELGYPAEAGLPELFDRVSRDGGAVAGAAITSEYERLIADAERRFAPVSGRRPAADVVVRPDPVGGYYVSPSIDGSRPGIFFARASGSEPRYTMPTTAYHEAVPGHHTQLALAQELDLPLVRRTTEHLAYTEGWALYAERLMWELGAYEDDPYGDLGRLQHAAWRAARLVVDPGIHVQDWSFDQAVGFLVERTGKPRAEMEAEVARYASIPGQATSYYVGYAKLLELREAAREREGAAFDSRSFHDRVLGGGAMPLDVLEEVIAPGS